MVINHYLGTRGLHVSDQASGPHTDHGIVTILWQDSLGGLEVMGKDGKWISATPLRGSFVINIGELMKRWTNGRFKATVHRVVHLRDEPRYSMPLFCNPNFRTIVDPRDLGVSRRRRAVSADPVGRVPDVALQGDPQAVGRGEEGHRLERRQAGRSRGGVTAAAIVAGMDVDGYSPAYSVSWAVGETYAT